MADTIQKVLRPLRLTFFFFGLGILRYPVNRPRRPLSVMYMFIVWSTYFFAGYHVQKYFFLKRLAINYLGCFIVIVNLFVTFISLIISFFGHESFEKCIQRIAIVDDTLEELGTPKEYSRMRNSIITLVFMWLGLVFLANFGDTLWCMEIYNDWRAMVIPLVMDYPIHVNSLTDMIFMFLMWYIGTRLDKINGNLLQLSGNECELKCTLGRSTMVASRYPGNVGYHRRILWTTMQLHLELCRIAHYINYMFSIQMTLQMMSYFVVITGIIYIQYSTLICLEYNAMAKLSVKLFLFSIIWLFIFTVKLTSMNHVCENVCTKAQKSKEVVHKLTILSHFEETRDEIYQFILQLSLRPLKISGLYLFYFGYNFVYKFFVQVLTFIILIMQTDTVTVVVSSFAVRNNISCHILNSQGSEDIQIN